MNPRMLSKEVPRRVQYHYDLQVLDYLLDEFVSQALVLELGLTSACHLVPLLKGNNRHLLSEVGGGWGHGAVNSELIEEVFEIQGQEQVPCRQWVLEETPSLAWK
jgi:hypothetical protein